MASRLTVIAAAALIAACGHAQVVGVLDSEYNRAEYPNSDQARLMQRLGELQVRYRVIHDADVLHPERLDDVAVIATAHTYVVAEEIGDALVEWVRSGGRLLWEDGPVKSESEALLRMFGVREGSPWHCHYLRGFEMRCPRPDHPLAETDAPEALPSFVGNGFPAASVEPGLAVFQGSGQGRLAGQTWDEATTHTVPAVIARDLGEGSAMLLNWMALRNEEPQVRAWVDRLLLRFLPQSVIADEYTLRASLPVRTFFRQPLPVRARVAYEPLDTGGAERVKVEMALWRGAARVQAARSWIWPAEQARRESLELPTRGLSDGVYTLRVRSSLDGEGWMEQVLHVRLCGEAHAAELAWREENPAAWARAQRVNERLRGFVGNYAVMPRHDDGSVDTDELIRLCKRDGLDTFDWTLSRRYEDFVKFLPAADDAGLKVWATLSSPRSMESRHEGGYAPHFMDYHAWAEELARLSLEHPSLVAWVIDDFDGDTKGLLTEQYVAEMVAKQRTINPELAFVPVIYTGFIRRTPDWMLRWGRHTDGIMWPYRPLEQTGDLAEEAADARACVGPNHGLYINVYCTSTSWHPEAPSGDYVASAMRISRRLTDGMRLYCLPWDAQAERHEAAVRVMEGWEAR